MNESVRLDVWLDIACLFKTRSEAKRACEGGKVEVNGEGVKRARLLQAGDLVRIRLGPYEHHVTVKGLSERRGPAAVAAELYAETAASRAARERLAWQLKHAPALSYDQERGRPTKRDRREIDRLRGR